MKLLPIESSLANWEIVERLPDRHIDRAWVEFVAETQKANPVMAELHDGSSVVGYFIGLTFSRFGVRILGSPFPGWATSYMGFALQPEVPRWLALSALPAYAFGELGCMYFEVIDRHTSTEDGERAGLAWEPTYSYQSDLAKPEDELFGDMTSACRRCIRKAAKSGVVIEEARDRQFAFDYYEQLCDVFRKQGLVPTYDASRVLGLMEAFAPTGRLLLLRGKNPNGDCIATGIYPAINTTAYFWGNASFRTEQHLRPNEALNWHALRYWKCHGMRTFDWGGGGSYKEKYGCKPIVVPRFYKSRLPFLKALRDKASLLWRTRQRLRGWRARRTG